MEEREMIRVLHQFYRLLQKENRALIRDEGAKLEAIVQQKELYVERLAYSGNVTTEIKEWIQKIQFLQEENLLLTQQAISYQQAFMDAIQHELKKERAAYQRTAYTKTAGSAAIIDQRI
ncbi:hypothetical protein [Enterococcus bulliens]